MYILKDVIKKYKLIKSYNYYHMSISTIAKKLSTAAIAATVIVLGIGAVAQATVLTFDDIAPVSYFDLIPNGYGGFNWNNFYYVNGTNTAVSLTGYDNGRVSGDYVGFNGGGAPAVVSGSIFDLNSAYLTAAWNSGFSVTVEGFKSGASLYSKTVVVNTTQPILVNFDYFGIDELKFKAFAVQQDYRTHFVLDNFTFNEKATSVPEPTLLPALLAIATVSAGSVLRRKQLKQS
ncbi:PEP-CTERM sorting domain-containing protein [Nostoc sp. LEGE 12450]|uniref:PEP-CTERM sorting domain-containing protein n=1 Tax=Nostoc sp. LEGE 12450 TaxID=1828643 RepID=UPI00187E051E|nr:PEP-CTERM sorting domain-containing protein [Nostoc sp. LEGE 12450]MBE8988946.1 PEP-CTERM sorting domain-containing protein [Nostoc sp. LEGE 12450]